VHFLPRGEELAATQRYAPGQLLRGRYLILGLLGEGAMGHVYRAEDKRLGGFVALKFLSAQASRDSEALKRLLNEARLARQVTHPNVCRVFDVDDVDGKTFISMEFVDGETIGSLLHRIGRLPNTKAVHVAHQICAGLAWAHERGILHRDLKPANIMLDGNGEVRIADFGLAGLAVDLIREGGRRAGTPAYMAPEVLRGEGVSERSDIYSLGLVLYELFTGVPVYRPSSISELEAMHDAPLPAPSTIVSDIEPDVERAIMACLERAPAQRPASVREISRMLPGGDPLSAALSAGQTPTPSQVAAAGSSGAIRPLTATLLSVAMIVAVMAAMWLGRVTSLLERVPMPKSAPTLAANAQDILERLGYDTQTRFKAFGFDFYEEYIELIESQDKSATRWDILSHPRPTPIDFWYRQSPRPLITSNPAQRVGITDPAMVIGGMVSVRLDTKGRLRELSTCTDPEARVPTTPAAVPDAKPLLEAAGLDVAALKPTDPVRTPEVFADTRMAWEGVYPDVPTEPIRVEAAFLAGKPVAFRIVELKWVEASTFMATHRSSWMELGSGLSFLLNAAALCIAIVLSWRNLRDHIGDTKGATRLAVLMALATFAAAWFKADHPRTLPAEIELLARSFIYSIPTGLWFWVCYLAIEPYARRLWPQMLISWSRLVRGDVLNPMVGKHIAVGVLFGVSSASVIYLHRLAAAWIGYPPSLPWIEPKRGIDALEGFASAFGTAMELLPTATGFALTFLVVMLFLKLITKHNWAAAAGYAVIQTILWSLLRGESPASVLFMGILAAACTLVLVRFGLLSLVAGVLMVMAITTFAPTVSLGTFWAPTATTALAAVIVTFAFGIILASGLVAPSQIASTSSTSRVG
jgi:serine/threonine-protein kinase